MNRPLLLLLITGTALGLNFPLGRMALDAGVTPALWAAFICLAAGCTMHVAAVLAGEGRGEAPVARYAFVSGFLSYVMPNFLTFLVIPRIGSGLAAIMFALSPISTALLSLMFKVRPPNALALTGIGFGLAGALVIIFTSKPDFAGGSTYGSIWLAVAVLVPVFLGFGNIYRTTAWPQGTGAMFLASRTNLAALPLLIILNLALTGTVDLAPLATHPGLCLAQALASTMMFLTFFRLQQLGGPTYLSQIGYVGAVVGVALGVFWFREVYPAMVWFGAGVVALGIGLTTIGQVRGK